MEWLANDVGIFFISGKPGTGKSTIMRYIHEDERTIKHFLGRKQKLPALISFFFHDLGIPSEKTFSGMLHALLCQLLHKVPGFRRVIKPQFKQLRRRFTVSSKNQVFWSEALKRAFESIQHSEHHEVRVLCIVDGRDECGENQLCMIKFLT